MKKASVLITILAFIAAPVAFANGGSVEAGKEAFMKHCATCHAADGNGKEAVAKLLKVTFPPLGSKEVQALTDTDMHSVILNGNGKMKPVKDLDRADIANVIAYVRSLAKK
ncbi:MAG TPA: cytochrome c [Candidatus Acidoferrales bacterium]|nr:cytochrome c [Candidatus Acidoferrales bacterium]